MRQEPRPSNVLFGLIDALPAIRRAGSRARTLPLVLTSILAIAALMAACSRAQSSDQSKLPTPAQSATASKKQLDAQKPLQPPQPVMRTVKVKFDYDFTRFPACSAKVTQECVQQFDVYDVSASPPVFLFSVPLPHKTKGMVKGIMGSAPQKLSLLTGPHTLGVSAKGPGLNYESSPYQSMTFVRVLPDNPATPAQAPGNSTPKK